MSNLLATIGFSLIFLGAAFMFLASIAIKDIKGKFNKHRCQSGCNKFLTIKEGK